MTPAGRWLPGGALRTGIGGQAAGLFGRRWRPEPGWAGAFGGAIR